MSGRALQGLLLFSRSFPLILFNPGEQGRDKKGTHVLNIELLTNSTGVTQFLRNSLSNLAVLAELTLTKLSKKIGLAPGLKTLRKDICVSAGPSSSSRVRLFAAAWTVAVGSSALRVFQARTLGGPHS